MANEFLGGILILFGLILLFVSVALVVIGIIANWNIFKKAGKEGWEAIIPFYNTWVLFEISGLNWWWFLIALSPVVISFMGIFVILFLKVDGSGLSTLANLVSMFTWFNCYYNLAKKFRKDTTTAVLAGIFNFIFIYIFAFSKKEIYYADEKVSPNGVIPGNENSTQTSNATTNEDNQIMVCTGCGCKIENNHKFCSVCGKENKQ